MITCRFENGGRAALRHVVVHAVAERDGALLWCAGPSTSRRSTTGDTVQDYLRARGVLPPSPRLI